MKPGEIRHTSGERLKGFEPGDFAVPAGGPSLEIAYYEKGKWHAGKLKETPVQAGGKITITIEDHSIVVGERDVEISIPPRKVENVVGGNITHEGKVWRIESINLGPNGEIWYDLESGGKKMRNIAQEYLRQVGKVEKAQEKLEAGAAGELARLKAEIQKVKGEKRKELMGRLTGLQKQVVEMRKILGGVEGWHASDEARIKEIGDKITKLQSDLEKEVEALDDAIVEELDNEKELAKGNVEIKEKTEDKNTAIGVRSRYEAVLADWDEIVPAAGALSWKEKNDNYQVWKTTVNDAKEKVVDCKKRLDAQVAADRVGAPPRGRGAPPPADSPETTALRAELVLLETDLRDKKALEPEKPGDRPSEDENNKRNTWLLIYKEYLTIAGDAANPDNGRAKRLIGAVEKIRKNQAVSEMRAGGDYDRADPAQAKLWDKVTAKALEEVIEKWKSNVDEKEKEIFDFDKEKTELLAKVAELDAKITALGGSEAAALKTKLDLIEKGSKTPPIEGVKKLAKGAGVEDKMIEFWKQLGDLEVEIDKVEYKRDVATSEKSVEGKVETLDLPADLMREIMIANAPGLHEAMSAAFDAVLDDTGNVGLVEAAAVKFFKDLDVDAPATAPSTQTLRQKLAERGVRNWEKFQKQFEKQLAGRMAGFLVQSVDAEARHFIAQTAPKSSLEQFKEQAAKVGLGKTLTKIGVNISVLVGAGIGMSALTGAVGIPSGIGVRGAATGGVLGAFRTGLQRLFGRDSSSIKQAEEQARKDMEKNARVAIRNKIFDNIFDVSAGPATVRATAPHNFEHALAAILREATQEKAEEEEKKITIGTGPNPITLKGEDVCLYYESLKRASQEEGAELTEATRYQYAAALCALRHNRTDALVEKTPAGIRALKWFTEAFSGKMKVPADKRPAGAALRPGEQPTAAETRASWKKQLLVTGVTGMAVGAALEAGGYLSRGAFGVDIARGAMGLATGGLIGAGKEFARQQREAGKEVRENLDNVVAKVNARLEKLRGGSHLTADEAKEAKSYFTLLSAMLSGTGAKAEGLAGIADQKEQKFFVKHAFDSSYFVQQNPLYKYTLKNLVVEMNRFGVLEMDEAKPDVKNFANALKALRQSTDQLEAEAKNSAGLRAKNFLKRLGKGAAYGVAFGGAAALLGAAFDFLRSGPTSPGGALHGRSEPVFTDQEGLNKWVAAQEAHAAAVGPDVPGGKGGTSDVVPPPTGKGTGAHDVVPTGKGVGIHEVAHVGNGPEDVAKSFGEKTVTTPWGGIEKFRGVMKAGGLLDSAGHVKGTNMSFDDWRHSELERLGYQYEEGGVILHPYHLGKNAEMELYEGGDGKMHVRYDMENGGVTVRKTMFVEHHHDANNVAEEPITKPAGKGTDEFKVLHRGEKMAPAARHFADAAREGKLDVVEFDGIKVKGGVADAVVDQSDKDAVLLVPKGKGGVAVKAYPEYVNGKWILHKVSPTPGAGLEVDGRWHSDPDTLITGKSGEKYVPLFGDDGSVRYKTLGSDAVYDANGEWVGRLSKGSSGLTFDNDISGAQRHNAEISQLNWDDDAAATTTTTTTTKGGGSHGSAGGKISEATRARLMEINSGKSHPGVGGKGVVAETPTPYVPEAPRQVITPEQVEEYTEAFKEVRTGFSRSFKTLLGDISHETNAEKMLLKDINRVVSEQLENVRLGRVDDLRVLQALGEGHSLPADVRMEELAEVLREKFSPETKVLLADFDAPAGQAYALGAESVQVVPGGVGGHAAKILLPGGEEAFVFNNDLTYTKDALGNLKVVTPDGGSYVGKVVLDTTSGKVDIQPV